MLTNPSRAAENGFSVSPSLPVVSIIIPCYNGVEFIAEAIESVLSQTYPRIEIVVVDDGSTDGSENVIAKYPVRCVRGPRKGVSAARNRGVAECTGDFVAFLDADDLLLPNAIQSGMNALMEHPEACMAVGAHNMVSHAGRLISTRRKPLFKGDYYATLLKSNFIECISSILFRRNAYPPSDWFKTDLRAAEDYEFYLRLAREQAICCHDEIVAAYRLHQTNASHDPQLMLTSTLRVIYAQQPYALHSFTRACCLSYGLWSWRRKYGRQLARHLVSRPAAEAPAETSASWRTLLRTYPTGALVAFAMRAFPADVALSLLGRNSAPRPTIHLSRSV